MIDYAIPLTAVYGAGWLGALMICNACWIVADANGQKLGFFYYSDRQGADTAADHLTREEAYAMAVNFARVPDHLARLKGKA